MVLTNEERHEIAQTVGDFWKYNCSDDDYHYRCKEDVETELLEMDLTDTAFYEEYDIIMGLIENLYRYDNWKARVFFEKSDVIIIQDNRVMINDVIFNHVWSIKKIGNEVSIQDMNDNEIAVISYYDIIDIRRCK